MKLSHGSGRRKWQLFGTLAKIDIEYVYDAISRLTNVPLEKVVKYIGELMKPDPASRSGEENGARLIFVDSERD